MRETEREKNRKTWIAAIAAFSLIGAVWFKTGIFFGTNDDRVITEMLAGTILQKPDPHVKIVNWLLAAPLCLLYGVAQEMPWYGLCLLLFQFLSWFVIFDGILCRTGKRFEIVAGVGVGCCCFLIQVYSAGLIQFTSTAVLLAASGYASFCLRRDKKGFVWFSVLELLAFLLRRDAMLMVQPLGAAVYLSLLCSRGKGFREDAKRAFFGWGAALLVILGIGALGNMLGYHGAGWRDYDRYNQARIAMFDYYGTPVYEEVKDILDRYGVSKTEYQAYCNYVMIDNDISSECAEELAAYAKEKKGSPDLLSVVSHSLVNNVYRDPLSGGSVSGALWIGMAVWIAVSGRPGLFLPLLGLGAARTAVWSYIIYKDRVLPRVTYPLLFCESLFLIVLFLCSYEKARESRRGRWLACCLLCVFFLQGYQAGKTQYRYVRSENEGQALYMEGLREIRDYCMREPDRRYFLETGSFSFYKGSALETKLYLPANGMYTGGWNANTPVLREYWSAYTKESWEDVYLIIYDDGGGIEEQSQKAVIRYFEEKSGNAPILADRITVSHGGSYLVWHF